jgi:hypothetical protein
MTVIQNQWVAWHEGGYLQYAGITIRCFLRAFPDKPVGKLACSKNSQRHSTIIL